MTCQDSNIEFLPKPTIHNFKDIEGITFGRLIPQGIIGYIYRKSGKRRIVWRCLCTCGNTTDVPSVDLVSGNTTSCGCYRDEKIGNLNRSHQQCFTRTHHAWANMLTRCTNPNSKSFADYGGRGIKVCERWLKFENFYADMGECPDGLTLERKKNKLGYFPENCQWDTRIKQANNKRNVPHYTYKNETHTLAEWCRKLGLKHNKIRQRIYVGWGIEKAFNTP